MPPVTLKEPPLESKSSLAAFPIFNVPFVTVIFPVRVIPAPAFIIEFAEFNHKPQVWPIAVAAVKGVKLLALAVESLNVPFVSVKKLAGAVKLEEVISSMLEGELPTLHRILLKLLVAPVPLKV